MTSKKKIVNSLKVDPNRAYVLHGPYEKRKGEIVLEKGLEILAARILAESLGLVPLVDLRLLYLLGLRTDWMSPL